MEKIKAWLLATKEPYQICDIAEHGCSGGVNGITYYTETCAFHDLHETEIWDFVYEQVDYHGKSLLQFVASLNGANDVGSMDQFKNLLVWFAVEHVAYDLAQEMEKDEEGEWVQKENNN